MVGDHHEPAFEIRHIVLAQDSRANHRGNHRPGDEPADQLAALCSSLIQIGIEWLQVLSHLTQSRLLLIRMVTASTPLRGANLMSAAMNL